MFRRLAHLPLCCVAAALIVTALSNCRKDEPTPPVVETTPAEPEAKVEAEPENAAEAEPEKAAEAEPEKAAEPVKETTPAATDDTQAQIEAKLAKADAYDGTVDKTVSKCTSCRLGMDGSADHAFDFAGYKLHFCSEKCKGAFEKDATKKLLALTVPEG